jgi:outer membrane protein assembly factor BamD (BamD/ComL family)
MFGMKFTAKAVVFVMAATMFVGSALAQGPARGRIEPARDEAMEMTAKHNLTVARYYLEKRKAYTGARDRLQEIMDTYADFSRMDEVLFLMGEVHYKLNKADKAGEFYNKMLKDYPASEFARKARERLVELKISPETTDDKKPASEKQSS